MKIGVSSYSFKKYMDQSGANYFAICDHAKEMGFDGIEFTDLSTEVQPAESETKLAESIRGYCEKISLPIFCYTVSADFAERKNEVERIMRKVDTAEALGVKLLRHDACWHVPENWHWIHAADTLAPGIREVAQYAADKGIRTCTENHGFFFQDANRVETLIRKVDHPNYGWLVDIGNFLCADESPSHALPIASAYAFHVHIKDFLLKTAEEGNPGKGWFSSRNGNFLRGTIPGHGVVPIQKCIQTLRRSGYSGCMSYEFEGMEDNLPALRIGLENIRRFTDAPDVKED